jgi:hypothetical protein
MIMTKELKYKYKNIITNSTEINTGEGWDALVESVLNCIDFHSRTSPQLRTKIISIKNKFGLLNIDVRPIDDYTSGIKAMATAMSSCICESSGSIKNDKVKGMCKCCTSKKGEGNESV